MRHPRVNEQDNFFNWLMLCLVLVLLANCAGTTTPTKPVDIAAESGKQISKSFLLAYDVAKQWTEKGTPAQKEYALTTLNPVVNKCKVLVVDFDRSVVYWQKTGLAGDDVVEKQKELEKLYNELQKLIIDAFAKKEV
jgi:hypothetical protein